MSTENKRVSESDTAKEEKTTISELFRRKKTIKRSIWSILDMH